MWLPYPAFAYGGFGCFLSSVGPRDLGGFTPNARRQPLTTWSAGFCPFSKPTPLPKPPSWQSHRWFRFLATGCSVARPAGLVRTRRRGALKLWAVQKGCVRMALLLLLAETILYLISGDPAVASQSRCRQMVLQNNRHLNVRLIWRFSPPIKRT